MEGFERYSAEKQDSDEVIVANLNEISEKGDYIDPVSLNLPKDFKKESLEAMQIEWSLSKDIISIIPIMRTRSGWGISGRSRIHCSTIENNMR